MMKKILCLLGALSGWLTILPVAVQAQLQLNEIYAAPGAGEAEWYEIINPTDQPVTLTGWQLAKQVAGEIKYHELLVSSEATMAGQSLLVFSPHLTLPNAGTTIYLLNPTGEIISQVNYPKLNSKQSYANLGTSNDDDWQLTTTLTPGEANLASPTTATSTTPASTTPITTTTNSSAPVIINYARPPTPTPTPTPSPIPTLTPTPTTTTTNHVNYPLPHYQIPSPKPDLQATASTISASDSGDILGASTTWSADDDYLIAADTFDYSLWGMTAIIIGTLILLTSHSYWKRLSTHEQTTNFRQL